MKRDGTYLYRGDTLIYLCDGSESGHPLIVKKPSVVHPPAHVIHALNNEFEILNSLSVKGVRKALKKKYEGGLPVLFLEYIRGDTLQEYVQKKNTSIQNRLRIARELSSLFMHVHEQKIVHNDVNSRNVLLSNREQSIVLIDFGSAFRVTSNTQCIAYEDRTKKYYFSGDDLQKDYSIDSIQYLSPEKTGQVDGTVDFRSDLYSLGVIFYELFTGKLPFVSDDPQGLLHKHVAEEPADPLSINPEIPEIINRIILKLMEKNAADRYQSALGLKSDLDVCDVQLQRKKKIIDFPLAQKDQPASLSFPRKLYGREKEMHYLRDVFRKVLSGESQLLLVSGYAGTGKTSLVREFTDSLTEERALFIEGKYDQQCRSIPYTGIAQAFHEFVSFVLSQPDEDFISWKQKLMNAAGELGKVLTDIFPRLELIIGTQKQIPKLSGPEAHNRLFYVFKRFMKTVISIRKPLVVFLDDLQWIDTASLQLFKSMISSMDLNGLFLIVAFRDNELYDGHPFVGTMKELEKERIVFHTLNIKSLLKAHTTQFLRDTLNPCERVEELSSILFNKTRGNPFFIRRIMKSLHESNYVIFDTNAEKWKWDRHAIRSMGITDNVADLLEERLLSLDTDMKNVLTVAACVGGRFMPSELAMILGQSEEEVLQRLNDAVQLQFLEHNIGMYAFAHDRVQQAAYDLLSEETRHTIHLKIGRVLLKSAKKISSDELIFRVADHLNTGVKAVTDQQEKNEIAQRNLEAAIQARKKSAWDAMHRYAEMGVSLLPPACWDKTYHLSLHLYENLVEAEYLHFHHENVVHVSDIVLKNARTVIEKIKVYEIRMLSSFAQYRTHETLETGLYVLRLLGVTLRSAPPEELDVHALSQIPEVTEPEKCAVMRILTLMFPSAMIERPKLLPRIVFTLLYICMEFGNSPYSSITYALYGMLLCRKKKTIEIGFHFGELALEMLGKHKNREVRSRVLEIVYTFIHPWKLPFHNVRSKMYTLVTDALETGNIEVVCNTRMSLCIFPFYMGESLKSLLEEQKTHIQIITELKQPFQRKVAEVWSQLVMNVRGNYSGGSESSKWKYLDEDELQSALKNEHGLTRFYFRLPFVVLYFLRGDYTKALKYGLQNDEYVERLFGFPIVTMHVFYFSLVLLKLYPHQPDEVKREHMKKIRLYEQRMRSWAEYAPKNYQNKWKILSAEKARALGDHRKALQLYEEAVIASRKSGFTHDEALSYECAAECCLEMGLGEAFSYYMRKAYYLYKSWGAGIKVAEFEMRYPKIFSEYPKEGDDRGRIDPYFPGMFNLDHASVVKAAQTLSLETDLESLLNKMMNIVMENSGADRVLLFLKQTNEWYVRAVGDFRKKQCDVLLTRQNTHGSDCEDSIAYPESVVNICIRTADIVVWNEEYDENEVFRDPYIVEKGVKSLLCIPLRYKAEFSGILYLENSLTPKVFHSGQIETLELLSSQLSISLENALLYRSVSERLGFERLLSELSAAFVNLAPDRVDERIAYWLKRLVSFLGADRGAIFEFKEEDALFCLSHFYAEPHVAKPPLILKHYSWLTEKMLDGQMIVLKDIEDLPEAARQEKRQLLKEGIKSCIVLPMEVGNSFLGILDFAFIHGERNWTGDFLQRLRLLEQIFANTLARKKSEEKLHKRTRELQETAEKLKNLSEHLQEVREHERASIAREIHDELGQALTVLRINASWIDKHLQDDTESLQMKIQEMNVFIDETIKTVQRISSELRPQILDILGLFAAVEWQIEELEKREGISCRLTCEGEEVANEKCAVVLFRVLQEALTNITRHAGATEVDVLLKIDGETARLEIRDNGRGITQEQIHSKSSLGLMGIRERVSFLNGTFKIIGRKNRGTLLTVSVPISEEGVQ